MAQIAEQMVALSSRLSHYRWRKSLQSDDSGLRMAGYAWLYVRPDPDASQLLVRILTTREESYFGQFWGLEALQRCLPLADADSVAALTPELEGFLLKLPPDSDRHYQLSDLLDRLGNRPEPRS